MSSKKKYLVTSALPYVNNAPHLGTLLPILSADVYARHLRLKKEDVFFVCGTDEHGTTTEIKAKEEGLSPQQIVNKYFELHKKVYSWFNCSFDSFGRTSSPENKKLTQEIFLDLYKNGYIFEKETTQLYCQNCKMFLSDRFVEGTCPKCQNPKARGDQCDKCGALLSPSDLINPKCKFCGSKPVEKTTKHLYIDLPKLEPQIKNFFNKRGNWSENAVKQTNAFLKQGLKPRPITRDLKWGIPVPLEEYKNKVFYVWFDAPIGYISITAEKTDYKEWWQNPNTELTQFMGKDNIVFHSILFPAMLLGTKKNWVLVKNLNVNEYLNYENKKFSKSKKIGVFGDEAMQTNIPADVWRYYLLANRPESNDFVFEWKDFQERLNNELVANLGNFINRTLTFIKNNFNSKTTEDRDKSNDKIFLEAEKEILSLLDKIQLKQALHKIMLFSKKANKYFQDAKPWILIKKDREKAQKIVNTLANLAVDLSILVSPFLPDTSQKIQDFFSLKNLTYSDLGLKQKNLEIKNHSLLFKKIDDKEIVALKKRFSGEVQKKKIPLDIKYAEIVSVREHPDAEKLYLLKIKLFKDKDSFEERQIVAGLKPFYSKEELEGRKILVLANLKPAKLRGELSEGMLLAADMGENQKPFLLKPFAKGKISFENAEIDSKQITYKEFLKQNLQIKNNFLYAGENKALLNNKPIQAEINKDAKVF